MFAQIPKIVLSMVDSLMAGFDVKVHMMNNPNTLLPTFVMIKLRSYVGNYEADVAEVWLHFCSIFFHSLTAFQMYTLDNDVNLQRKVEHINLASECV